MNVLKLKSKIVENGISIDYLSSKLDMNQSTFYRRLNDEDKFTVGEVKKISEILELNYDDIMNIFFVECVA